MTMDDLIDRLHFDKKTLKACRNWLTAYQIQKFGHRSCSIIQRIMGLHYLCMLNASVERVVDAFVIMSEDYGISFQEMVDQALEGHDYDVIFK